MDMDKKQIREQHAECCIYLLSRKETPDLGVTKLHYLLSAVHVRGDGFGPHQPEFLENLTNCLKRGLFETNGISK